MALYSFGRESKGKTKLSQGGLRKQRKVTDLPGPEEYNPKFQTIKTRSPSWGMGKPPNFKISESSYSVVPGPGTYHNGNGSLNNSLNKSMNKNLDQSRIQGSSFGKNSKLKFQDFKVPGPGEYQHSKEYLVSPRPLITKFGKDKRRDISMEGGTSEERINWPSPTNYNIKTLMGTGKKYSFKMNDLKNFQHDPTPGPDTYLPVYKTIKGSAPMYSYPDPEKRRRSSLAPIGSYTL
jgi:hypothetical protein